MLSWTRILRLNVIARPAQKIDTPVLAALLGLLTLSLAPLLFRLEFYPAPWSDEGYTTHTAYNLITFGWYGTWLRSCPRITCPFWSKLRAWQCAGRPARVGS
jgi:hypothetical protein